MAAYNIVTAVFDCCNPVKAVATPESWQWDIGQVLRIQGLKIPNGTQAHFNADGQAITQVIGVVDDIGYVYVPDVFLQQSGQAKCYIYISEDDATAETEYVIQFMIRERVQPEDYSTPTEAQETLFQQAIDAVRIYAERADDDATLAESWAVGGTGTREGEDTNNSSYFATQAASSASDAHGDAVAAANSTSDAHIDAVVASGSASDAHNDAVAALEYKNDASGSAEDANTYAGQALISKNAAAASALVAEG